MELRAAAGSSEDCKCYLRILSVYEGSNPASGSWHFEDVTLADGTPTPNITGTGQNWDTGPGTAQSLPSSFFLLDGPPSYGDRVFILTDPDGTINVDLTVNIEVHCVGSPGTLGGNPLYITTYTESYVFNQGTIIQANSQLFHILNANTTFDCLRDETGGS